MEQTSPVEAPHTLTQTSQETPEIVSPQNTEQFTLTLQGRTITNNRSVSWEETTVDNENQHKKSSKGISIFLMADYFARFVSGY